MLSIFIALLVATPVVSAQEQESKLIDRLLRPNLSSVNPAQNRRFDAVDLKREQSTRFSLPSTVKTKSFPDRRTFLTRKFAAGVFTAGEMKESNSIKSHSPEIDTAQIASVSFRTSPARENGNTLQVTSFANNRSFADRGKNQDTLRAHETPLTIEQVRELLNRNK